MKAISRAGARHTLKRWLVLATVWGCLVTTLMSTGQAQALVPEDGFTNVTVNGTRLTDDQVFSILRLHGAYIPDGSYWYDRLCGAWGLEGGPTLGFTLPYLTLGGPLQADASAGDTGVFINGRELHWMDVTALRQALQLAVNPGRYWLDAYGNVWNEYGLFELNLVQRARQVGARTGGPWSFSSDITDARAGGDGQGFLYYYDKDVSWHN